MVVVPVVEVVVVLVVVVPAGVVVVGVVVVGVVVVVVGVVPVPLVAPAGTFGYVVGFSQHEVLSASRPVCGACANVIRIKPLCL